MNTIGACKREREEEEDTWGIMVHTKILYAVVALQLGLKLYNT